MFEDIFSPTPSKITNEIYQGNLNSSKNKEVLKGLGITFIITGLMGIAFMGFMGIKL